MQHMARKMSLQVLCPTNPNLDNMFWTTDFVFNMLDFFLMSVAGFAHSKIPIFFKYSGFNWEPCACSCLSVPACARLCLLVPACACACLCLPSPACVCLCLLVVWLSSIRWFVSLACYSLAQIVIIQLRCASFSGFDF